MEGDRQNRFDRGSAGLRTGNGGKTGKEGGNSGQSAGFGEDARHAREAKCPQRCFDGGGYDGKGPLFVLYPRHDLFARAFFVAFYFHKEHRDRFAVLVGVVDYREIKR